MAFAAGTAAASIGAWAWHHATREPLATRDALPPVPLPPQLARRFDPGATYGMGPSRPPTPLPDDPTLAAWVVAVERALYPTLELLYLDAQLAEYAEPRRDDAARAGDAEAVDVASLARAQEAKAAPMFAAVESSGLPEGDTIRRRARQVMAAMRALYQPSEAARQAEAWGLLYEASSYYRKAGLEYDVARLANDVRNDRGDLDDAARGLPPVLVPFARERERGPEGARPWNCRELGVSCLEVLPDNARVRRAFALAFEPAPWCGSSSPQEGFDVAEPLLRATAEAAPDELGRTFAFLTYLPRRGIGWRGHAAPSGAVPGDFGTSDNVLYVMRDLFRENPAGAAAFARTVGDVAGAIEGGAGPRWTALIAYLEEGAPDPGGSDDAWRTLIDVLARGTPRQRRWALGWVGPAGAVHRPYEAPKGAAAEREAAFTKAVTEAALQAEDDEAYALAMRALVAYPNEAALPAIVRAAEGRAWRDAARALAQLFGTDEGRRLWRELPPPWGSRWQILPPSPAMRRAAAALRRGFGPHVCDDDSTAAFEVLALLEDPALDEITAACVASRPPGWTALAHQIGRDAPAHPSVGWSATERELRRWAERGATPFEIESVTKMADDLAALRRKAR